MKPGLRNFSVFLVALFTFFATTGCSKVVPANASIVNVNDALARQERISTELPVQTYTFQELLDAYPSAIFVNVDGKVIAQDDDSPYLISENEFYLGPLRMDAYYKGASSVEKFESNAYVKGVRLSWWKAKQLHSSEILPVPEVKMDKPIPIKTNDPVSIYFMAFVCQDEKTKQYAVLKDSRGLAEGIWMVQ